MRAAVATCGVLAALALAPAAAAPGAESAPSRNAAGIPDVFAPPFAVLPLDSLRVTGGYGEPRSNHFHAGFDFSTNGRVGRAVRAPAPGRVERVRASGAGYGRSLYLRIADGRLLVFGHLDAFAPALAAWVDSAQRATGQYEQDLWPPPGRFAHAAGDTIAWSGESGAGGPHLHLEIRHDDFAVHPLRGGLPLAAPASPRLQSLTLEPLDADTRVAGGVWPRTFALRERPDTIEVVGRVRAAVRSVSGVRGAEDAPAWSTALQWRGASVEARLDSISWAGEMSEIDEVLDRGRLTGRGGLLLWAPPGWRPRFVRASAPLEQEAGTIEVRPGDPPRELRIVAREPGGVPTERVVVLRPPGASSAPPPAVRAARAPHGAPAWSFAVLPGPLLRVRVSGAPAALAGTRIACARDSATAGAAQWDGAAWVAILDPGVLPNRDGFRISGRTGDGHAWESRASFEVWPAGDGANVAPAPGRLALGAADVFERGLVLVRVLPGANAPGQGLVAAGPVLRAWPEALPLRRAPQVALPAPGAGTRGLGLYRRRTGGRWEWMGATPAAGTIGGDTSFLGDFAVLRDTLAPRVRLLAPLAHAGAGPYSRWQLAATVAEEGSGVDARASAFVVDGERVPTEWDPEARVLRWRPLAPPASGRHAYELRVADRAGNRASRRGTFVLDSGGR